MVTKRELNWFREDAAGRDLVPWPPRRVAFIGVWTGVA